MALLINQEVNLTPDIKINNIYVRFGYRMREDGISVNVNPIFFTSKNSYVINSIDNIKVPALPKTITFKYSRDDEVDILLYIHNEYIKYICEDHYEVEAGEEVLSYSKFTNIENIEIVDLNEYDMNETD